MQSCRTSSASHVRSVATNATRLPFASLVRPLMRRRLIWVFGLLALGVGIVLAMLDAEVIDNFSLGFDEGSLD